MTTLKDYEGHVLAGTVYCGDHTHRTEVKVTDETNGALKVETVTGDPFCSMDDETIGWVWPIGDDDLEFGSVPFHGHVESSDTELELDFWE
jgi:hypothetical protein